MQHVDFCNYRTTRHLFEKGQAKPIQDSGSVTVATAYDFEIRSNRDMTSGRMDIPDESRYTFGRMKREF